MDFLKTSVTGKAKLAIQAFAESLLIIPKTLAENSGFDVMVNLKLLFKDVLIKAQEERHKTKMPIGINVFTSEPLNPVAEGIW